MQNLQIAILKTHKRNIYLDIMYVRGLQLGMYSTVWHDSNFENLDLNGHFVAKHCWRSNISTFFQPFINGQKGKFQIATCTKFEECHTEKACLKLAHLKYSAQVWNHATKNNRFHCKKIWIFRIMKLWLYVFDHKTIIIRNFQKSRQSGISTEILSNVDHVSCPEYFKCA